MITVRDSGGFFVRYEESVFPGGEIHVRFTDYMNNHNHLSPFKIDARLTSSNEVMKLLLITDTLRRKHPGCDIDLILPYVPYGRQDRVCNKGESLSVKVFCQLINSQGYRSVETWDPHSDVTSALIDRCTAIQQNWFVRKIPPERVLLISPDVGALKKVIKCAIIINTDLVTASKIRDPKTGDISGTECDVTGVSQNYNRLLIVDDICDGGRTFIELTKVIKKQVTLPVDLYVTHGIFSKGLQVLWDAGIDHIYTANSWIALKHPKLTHIQR